MASRKGPPYYEACDRASSFRDRPGDIDGRSPAVVVWHDGAMIYLVASGELGANELSRIAMSMYDGRPEERQA
jgi:hypothetical protein